MATTDTFAYTGQPITKQLIDATAARMGIEPVTAIRLLVTGTTAAAMFSKPTLQTINGIWKQYQKESSK